MTHHQLYGPAAFPDKGTCLEREWGTEELLVLTGFYTMKLITMSANTQGGLQYHRYKDEAGYVLSGSATVEYDDGTGEIQTIGIGPGSKFRFPRYAVHRVTSGKNGLRYIEVSTPYLNDRVHVEHQYDLPRQTGGLESTAPWEVVQVPEWAGLIGHPRYWGSQGE